jgi:hypothetical protein
VKKIFLSLVFSFVLVMPAVGMVSAEAVDIVPESACSGNGANNSPACNKSTEDPITGTKGVLLKVANILAWFGGAIAVVMVIFAGFNYVTSAGDAAKVKRAKDIILYALVGLVVIVVSRVIVIFVINKVVT